MYLSQEDLFREKSRLYAKAMCTRRLTSFIQYRTEMRFLPTRGCSSAAWRLVSLNIDSRGSQLQWWSVVVVHAELIALRKEGAPQ